MHVMEYTSEGVLTTIIGMGVVFIVLIILSIFIKILNTVVDAAIEKKTGKDHQVRKQPAGVVSPSPAKAPVTNQIKPRDSISPAVVAAITASICALTGKTAEEFKFTEIRRASGSQPVWSFIGTNDVIATRQRFIEKGNRP
ncbi:hypothetical protein DCMF_06315 [Candidatus Formimonas warabiya]|uniref:Uncharacterized protein n=2 Tax=Formimonas warabiya TaxID=1761012 RepID=A0A3G1KQQ3_FORW1|nr:hypothetical protein DCMF_06315 [Candidatus Formimonas warabiya]